MSEEEAASGREAHPSILFTAFEPSGDALAAPVITALREHLPGVRVYAWGGPKMENAGATLVGESAKNAAMGPSSLGKVARVRREIRRIRSWSRAYRVVAHVAVDSPAANFPICRIMRRSGARVVHLVAPQLWAWGRWRVRKLRALTDLVLCVLPFEEQWFRERDIPARFIGHPRMNRKIDKDALKGQIGGLPQGSPRIAIFPGSRAHEVRANMRMLARVFIELHGRHSGAAGLIVAANPEIAKLVRKKLKVFPSALHMVTDQLDASIAWSDLCLAVSGTVTLDIARQQKPMVGVYKTSVLAWLGSKLILRTPHRLLPNLIAGREIVPEFVPYCDGAMPIVKEAHRILLDSKNSAIQAQELAHVCQRFVNMRPAELAARRIVTLIATGNVD